MGYPADSVPGRRGCKAGTALDGLSPTGARSTCGSPGSAPQGSGPKPRPASTASCSTSSAIARARPRFARRSTRPAPSSPSHDRWISPCSCTDWWRAAARSAMTPINPVARSSVHSEAAAVLVPGDRCPRGRGDLARSAQNPSQNSTERWTKPHGTVTAEHPGHRRALGSHQGGRPRAAARERNVSPNQSHVRCTVICSGGGRRHGATDGRRHPMGHPGA